MTTLVLNCERLAPEHPFPTGINDCWDTLKWVARNVGSLGANPNAGFVIGGASAGGNITAILAHLARDEKLEPALTGQYLCVPAVMPPISVPEKYKTEYISPRENVNDPVLKMSPGDDPYEGLQKILKMDLTSPLFNPCMSPNGHRGLPRAFFQICGMDPLRDEGLCYEKLIREDSGVVTKLQIYPGFGHMFWTNYPQLEKSNEFVKDTLEGIRWLFSST
jgi:acetyl esterase/lipase